MYGAGLEVSEDVMPVYASPRTAESHRVLVRGREGVGYAPGKARKIAAKAMTRAPSLFHGAAVPVGADPGSTSARARKGRRC
ncbi:hypothetical protein GCM10022226_46400 [Sphaerisporangium flaviroseum]|uniref:Uncharacterized protein n=1 Tax=Sphaerisporangium flaviroseum TaxID=509199 RepID=A0ABP7IK98_9ACTN